LSGDLIVFEHFKEEPDLRYPAVLTEHEGMTLCLSQFMAHLADNAELQLGIFAKPCLQRGHRYPVSGYGGHRLSGVDISSFPGQPNQVIGKQKGDDMLRLIWQGLVRLHDAGDDVEDSIGVLPFPVNRRALPKADNRRDDRELRAFLIGEQVPPAAIQGTP
jgi:hypothetical protein